MGFDNLFLDFIRRYPLRPKPSCVVGFRLPKDSWYLRMKSQRAVKTSARQICTIIINKNLIKLELLDIKR